MGGPDQGLFLLNAYQHGFPLVEAPFQHIAEHAGQEEAAVLDFYRQGLASGLISRIGAVVAPRRVSWSTLAALAVPQATLAHVGTRISQRAEINHNYEREDTWNLWFVLSERDESRGRQVLAEIAADVGSPALAMPLLAEYHIDLGFDLQARAENRVPGMVDRKSGAQERSLTADEYAALAALDDGLSLVARPYAELGERIGLSENAVIELLKSWLDDGVLKRFGVVVRHRPLGYTANAMCVWDVPDEQVDALGGRLAEQTGVTLCYRRERARPAWPYNLYCMIHGRQREQVLTLRAQYAERLGLDQYAHKVLFSGQCFKQCGARFGGRS